MLAHRIIAKNAEYLGQKRRPYRLSTDIGAWPSIPLGSPGEQRTFYAQITGGRANFFGELPWMPQRGRSRQKLSETLQLSNRLLSKIPTDRKILQTGNGPVHRLDVTPHVHKG